MVGKETRSDGRYMNNKKGTPLCFAWNRNKDGCHQKCPNKRAHQCEYCLSQAHRAIDCEKKPEGKRL